MSQCFKSCCFVWMLIQCVQVRKMRVDIETCSILSAGQTVCDMWSQSQRPVNATVALVWSSPIYLFSFEIGTV